MTVLTSYILLSLHPTEYLFNLSEDNILNKNLKLKQKLPLIYSWFSIIS